ncbi:MAG: OmpA family protein [Deltaproteobacteria bacterium]|nr:OmpA family protein [Deltaproteobacteria bacterium]
MRHKYAAIAVGFASLVSGQLAMGAAGVARFSPTHPGETSFWIDDPVYGQVPRLAAALTLDYAHDPLVLGVRSQGKFDETQSVIEHQLWGHAQLGVALANRLAVSLSVPVRFWEDGTAQFGVKPDTGLGLGDIRASALIRLLNDGQTDAYSAHLGLSAWVPSANSDHAGDEGAHLQARLILSGRVDWFRWGALGSFTYRKEATVGTLPAGAGNTVGPELAMGVRAGWASSDGTFLVQPEFMLWAATPGGHWFQRSFTAIETNIGAHVRLPGGFVISLAPGLGALRQPGTPDLRVLMRFGWMAPDVRPEVVSEPVIVPPPPPPPPPPPDTDRDGFLDRDDACPTVKGVASENAKKHGCPADADDDGVLDADDACPAVAQGPTPDPTKKGCPALDDDGDKVWNHEDQCPAVSALPLADPEKRGCPLPDRDSDSVADAADACPDKPGAPHPDPKRNGCPGLVQVKDGKLVILMPVFFATNKDKVLKKSFPVLTAVSDALAAQPQIAKVRVEGHTDDRGNADKNTDLSRRRAESVRQFLIQKGIDPERLTAEGFGPAQPIETNKTSKGRAANRRVEFKILERKDETP